MRIRALGEPININPVVGVLDSDDVGAGSSQLGPKSVEAILKLLIGSD
jgi:hypothetical protein